MTKESIKYYVLVCTTPVDVEEFDNDGAVIHNGYTAEAEPLEIRRFDTLKEAMNYINNYNKYFPYEKQFAIVSVDMDEDTIYTYEECLYYYNGYEKYFGTNDLEDVDIEYIVPSDMYDALCDRVEYKGW